MERTALAGTEQAAVLYVELLKRALTRALFEDSDDILGFQDYHVPSWRRRAANRVGRLASRHGFELVRKRPYDSVARANGRDWPARAETMVGLKRLDNLHECVATVIRDGVDGDLLEAGVWRGGASIFMRGLLAAYGDAERLVWVADSFEGLPPADPRYPLDAPRDDQELSELAVGLDEVRHNFERYGLLDDRVRFLAGWFKDSLPTAPIDRLAVLRLDGDMYESTSQALDALYHRLSPGGFCIIDDYAGLEACAEAVHDFRAARGIDDEMVDIDGCAAYWRKSTTG